MKTKKEIRGTLEYLGASIDYYGDFEGDSYFSKERQEYALNKVKEAEKEIRKLMRELNIKETISISDFLDDQSEISYREHMKNKLKTLKDMNFSHCDGCEWGACEERKSILESDLKQESIKDIKLLDKFVGLNKNEPKELSKFFKIVKWERNKGITKDYENLRNYIKWKNNLKEEDLK